MSPRAEHRKRAERQRDGEERKAAVLSDQAQAWRSGAIGIFMASTSRE